ncbi:Protein CBR-MRPL-46 [Caenorhabditis briggsae]|uniref:SRR1-like domain-containing protein n=2 Tax=Caenorhabditis briggsae TaxID=6238 RepID=A0AAE9D6Y2_CAEBR|nr:Protein CBR-MRPL-46 [Caenorhabditis briggsae]ULT97690.1 hypothetical protein L3Y34_005489 [Caenorhabditis briggsae]CAP20647.1 Protein CBR-MRPL-46 [Caenorhabditis briggsae]
MEDDGFTLVTGKKAGKPANRAFKKSANSTHIRVDGSLADVEKSITAATAAIQKSGLATWLQRQIERILEEKKAGNSNVRVQKIDKIVLIGNGHFDWSDQPGAHQFALFLEISRIFHVDSVVFQDPCISEPENRYLELKNVENRQKIDTKIDIGDGADQLSIFVLIHGEHEIFSDFLEHNWLKIAENQNCVVIGNNYGGIDWQLSIFRKNHPKIDQFWEKSKITPFPEIYKPHNSAFSSTVIMCPDFE